MPSSGVQFSQLALCEPVQRALRDKGYTSPSPIQAQAIPHLLQGKDLIGCAQTGTGKTAAFSLPILHMLATNPKPPGPRQVRCLILTPTRELASQIVENINNYGKYLRLTHTVVFGGVSQHWQVRKLQRGVDILVATPGRLLDLKQQGHLRLDAVEIFVLDEADRMLDLGFVVDVRKVLAMLPPRRQSLLFSATMPPAIQQLANGFLNSPVQVEVTPVASTAERIEQRLCFVDRDDKHKLLVHTLQQHPQGLVLVFVRMKHSANRLVDNLDSDGIRADAIHGNKSQAARERALQSFRTGRTRVLVATDIAARGIDVKGVALVINFDLPEEPESYVHRIGRTARAGAEGLAISFCDRSERNLVRTIERLIRQPIPVVKDHPFHKGPSLDLAGGNNRGDREASRSMQREFSRTSNPQRRPGGHARRNEGGYIRNDDGSRAGGNEGDNRDYADSGHGGHRQGGGGGFRGRGQGGPRPFRFGGRGGRTSGYAGQAQA
ncbi:DEAD/DEAH box helicase [Verrucomicrobia bacterium LW23]|nr:DEAD/DEAH box helicase [Verrucomicrobia bacterium LW23]